MILTHKEILKRIERKKIIIDPLDNSSVGCASIDLSLSKTIRIFSDKKKVIMLSDCCDFKSITKPVDISDGYLLKPGELVLGITEEKITLPDNICGWLNSRSRFARIGLMSHMTAPFICPGVSNRQVLEIYNAGSNLIKLMPGIKICQLVLQECKGNAKYDGIFKNQEF